MSISNTVNESYEFKKNIYPFVYYFENNKHLHIFQLFL